MDDIIEFAEIELGCKLLECQKALIRNAYELYGEHGNLKIVIRKNEGRNDFYTYLKQNNLPIAKELEQYGTTTNCNK